MLENIVGAIRIFLSSRFFSLSSNLNFSGHPGVGVGRYWTGSDSVPEALLNAIVRGGGEGVSSKWTLGVAWSVNGRGNSR